MTLATLEDQNLIRARSNSSLSPSSGAVVCRSLLRQPFHPPTSFLISFTRQVRRGIAQKPGTVSSAEPRRHVRPYVCVSLIRSLQ